MELKDHNDAMLTVLINIALAFGMDEEAEALTEFKDALLQDKPYEATEEEVRRWGLARKLVTRKIDKSLHRTAYRLILNQERIA